MPGPEARATEGRVASPATGMPPLVELLAPGDHVPGPVLAARLGLSRAAVWKQVEGLRKAGLEISGAGGGYRLAAPLQALEPAAIRAALRAPVRRQLGVLENHWRLDSTSNEIMRRAAALPDASFVFAEWQDAGRGRRGRAWHSPPATNLQFSCLKRFAGSYASLAGLSLAVGLAVAWGLQDRGVQGIALKWPNDLVHGDAKLGGILVELGGEFTGPCHAVIGVGINVRMPAALRAALGRPCTDLAAVCGDAVPARGELAAAVVARLVMLLAQFDAHGFAPLREAWMRLDALAGRSIRVQGTREDFQAIAAGVDARGALQVHTAGGPRSIDSAEVSVRPA